MGSYIVVFVTASSPQEAERIKDRLLEEKKVACVNILKDIDSYFFWQGRIEHEKEVLMIIKTREELLEEIVDLIKKVHSYSVPEIIALPIVGGNKEYLCWIDESIKK